MSDEKKSGEGNDNKKGEGNSELDSIKARLAELEASNRRLQDESKTFKTRAQEAEKKLDDLEKEKLEKSGDKDAQLKAERERAEKIAEDNKKLRAKTLQQNIRSVVSKFAGEIHDIDDFMNQHQFSKILQEGIDAENLTVSEDKAKEYVNKVLEAKPWMKKNPPQAEVDATKPNGKEVDKSIASMELDDLKAELKKQISGSN